MSGTIVSGMLAHEVALSLPTTLGLAADTVLRFTEYLPKPGAPERTTGDADLDMIVKEWLAHRTPGQPDIIETVVGDFTAIALRQRIEDAAQRMLAFAICSECRFATGRRMHIPMVDLRCDVSSRNTDLLIKSFKVIDVSGVLLSSGKSFHFCGLRLTHEEWVWFLGQCLLFKEMTDARYIGHRLLQGMSVLRLNAVPPTKPEIPTVVGFA